MTRPRDDEISDEKLMRYLDGELSREEGRDVERALDRPDVQARVDVLAQLHDVVRARYEAAADEDEPRLAAMWERLRPDLGPARLPARPPPFWARVREWLDGYRSQIMTGVVAAAAGAVLATFVAGGRERVVYLPAPGGPTVATVQAAEVESLEVLGGTGEIFHFSDDDKSGTGTTVIWVTQNEPEAGPEGPI